MERKKLNFASSSFFYSADEWDQIDLTDDEIPLVGNDTKKIIRLGTKNIIEAPEKSFKTTFFQRFALGLSCGKTVYKDFPVAQQARVLYFHGELTPSELAERRKSAIASIPGFTGANYIEGRSVAAHFIIPVGQEDIRKHVAAAKPEDPSMPYVVIFDPWQEFIIGHDENSFEDISKATKFLNKLMVDYRCTLFIQMHQGKDRTKGARGHSSISGWKDATIRLLRKGDKELMVRVEPRWEEKFEFGLTFRDGTMYEKKQMFTPNTERIKRLVEIQGGRVQKEELVALIGGKAEAARQALHRAHLDGAVVFTESGYVAIPWDFEDYAPPLP